MVCAMLTVREVDSVDTVCKNKACYSTVMVNLKQEEIRVMRSQPGSQPIAWFYLARYYINAHVIKGELYPKNKIEHVLQAFLK